MTNKKKFCFFFALIVILIVFLGGSKVVSKNNKNINYTDKKDYAIVYNSEQQKIKIITSKKSVEYLSELIGDLSAEDKGIHKRMKKDGKLHYQYTVFSHNDGSVHKINLYVYSNKQNIKMTKVPVISYGVWGLNTNQFKKLNDLKEFK